MGPMGTSSALQGRAAPGQRVAQIATEGGDDRSSFKGVSGVALDAQSIPDLPEETTFARGDLIFNLRFVKRTILSLPMLNFLLRRAHKHRVDSLNRLINGLGADNDLDPDMIAFDQAGRARIPDDRGLLHFLAALQTADQVLSHIFPMGFYKGNSNTVFRGANIITERNPFAYACTVENEYFGDLEEIVNNCNAQTGDRIYLVLYRDHPKPAGHPLSLLENYGPWQFKMIATPEKALPAMDRNSDLMAALHLFEHRHQPILSPGEMISQKMKLEADPRERPVEWVDQTRSHFSTLGIRFTDLRFAWSNATKRVRVKQVSDAPPYHLLGEVQLENNYVSEFLPEEQIRFMQSDPTSRLVVEYDRSIRLLFNLRVMQ